MESPKIRFGYPTIQYSPLFLDSGPSVISQLTAAHDAGFSWIALDRHTAAREDREGRLTELCAAAAAIGAPCLELQALIVTSDAEADAQRTEQLARHVRMLQPSVVTSVFKTPLTDAVLDRFLSLVDRLVDGNPAVRVGLEFSPLFDVATIRDAREILARADRPELGLVVDSWHVCHGGSTWRDLELLPLEDIVLVHFCDHGELAGPLATEKNRRLPPGKGILDLDRFVDILRRKGYDREVEVEVVSDDLRSLPPNEYANAIYAAGAPYWGVAA